MDDFQNQSNKYHIESSFFDGKIIRYGKIRRVLDDFDDEFVTNSYFADAQECRVESDSITHTTPRILSNPLGFPENSWTSAITTIRELESSRKNRNILMLQGPVGPFFHFLQKAYIDAGFETSRVLFHAADGLFSGKKNTIRFSGNLQAWENWLRAHLGHNNPAAIILFGSNRPAHQTARKLATEFGVKVIALEEGYMRSGYITCEMGGNNQHSPLSRWQMRISQNSHQAPLDIRSSFFTMHLWGASTYLWREITKQTGEQSLYHRETSGALTETISWASHVLQRSMARFLEYRTIANLINGRSGNYILVPLQTPSDAQMRTASRGWDNEKLVNACLTAIRNSDANQRMVFKTHPLDEKSGKLVRFIRARARQFGVSEKISVIQSGKLGTLAKHSTGMIVINSTSAFSALHHLVPILVLGNAIFRHQSVVTVGESEDCIGQFLVERKSKDSRNISSFINHVKEKALIPGDFYNLSTQRVTAENVVKRVKLLMNVTAVGIKA